MNPRENNREEKEAEPREENRRSQYREFINEELGC